MKLNKKTRFVSIIIGLLLIGLIVYKFIKFDMENPLVYHGSFPEIVNTIIMYAILGIKILAIILISTGARKALIAGVFFMAVALGEAVFLGLDQIKSTLDLFNAQPLDQFFNLLSSENYIYLGLIGSFSLYWLFYTIFVLANILIKKGPKIILFIIGLAPFAVIFQLLMEDNFKIDLAKPIYELTFNVSVIFLVSLMLMFTQRRPKKPQGKHVWFPVIETM